MTRSETLSVELIPVDQINVLNPRLRDKRVFQDIVDSISSVGLKKPITVSHCQDVSNGARYNLVCGQGRLEAYLALEQSEIPAIVLDISEEDCLIRSLVENLARRQHRPLELLQDIGVLKKRGYTDTKIAQKTGLSYAYVHGIAQLLEKGEERLLTAVGSRQMPISVAIEIAAADDDDVQQALTNAYEKGLLRGKKLIAAKRLVEQRRRRGKAQRWKWLDDRPRRVSSETLVRAYRQEADRQRLMVKKAEITQNRLLFVIEALRKLLNDENFVTLLRAESLGTMPRPLADLIASRERR